MLFPCFIFGATCRFYYSKDCGLVLKPIFLRRACVKVWNVFTVSSIVLWVNLQKVVSSGLQHRSQIKEGPLFEGLLLRKAELRFFSLFRNSDRLAGTFRWSIDASTAWLVPSTAEDRSPLLKTGFIMQVRELKIQGNVQACFTIRGCHNSFYKSGKWTGVVTGVFLKKKW
jgi:hypothetical protein